jgi:hypothetical protein
MPRGGKTNLAPNESIKFCSLLNISTSTPKLHEKLIKRAQIKLHMQHNQLPIKTPVALKDNFITSNSQFIEGIICTKANCAWFFRSSMMSLR